MTWVYQHQQKERIRRWWAKAKEGWGREKRMKGDEERRAVQTGDKDVHSCPPHVVFVLSTTDSLSESIRRPHSLNKKVREYSQQPQHNTFGIPYTFCDVTCPRVKRRRRPDFDKFHAHCPPSLYCVHWQGGVVYECCLSNRMATLARAGRQADRRGKSNDAVHCSLWVRSKLREQKGVRKTRKPKTKEI